MYTMRRYYTTWSNYYGGCSHMHETREDAEKCVWDWAGNSKGWPDDPEGELRAEHMREVYRVNVRETAEIIIQRYGRNGVMSQSIPGDAVEGYASSQYYAHRSHLPDWMIS